MALQLLHGDIEQLRREYMVLFTRGVSITRKLGFSDVIMPGRTTQTSSLAQITRYQVDFFPQSCGFVSIMDVTWFSFCSTETTSHFIFAHLKHKTLVFHSLYVMIRRLSPYRETWTFWKTDYLEWWSSCALVTNVSTSWANVITTAIAFTTTNATTAAPAAGAGDQTSNHL